MAFCDEMDWIFAHNWIKLKRNKKVGLPKGNAFTVIKAATYWDRMS